MNDELSREARSVIDGARAGDDPDAAARDRVRAKVMATIAAGGAATAGGSSASTTGVSAGKIGVALVLAGVIAAVVYLALRSPDEPARRAPTPAVVQAEPAPVEVPAPVVVPEPEAEPEIDTPPPTLSRKPPRAPATDTLAAERALLAKANKALRAGDTGGALAALAEHQQRFPRGLLIEERGAAKVLVLCAAGRTADAIKARDAFLAKWPNSVHAARVQAACR